MNIDLDELERVARAADRGPWRLVGACVCTDGSTIEVTECESTIEVTECDDDLTAERNAAHIAAASPDVVLAHIRRTRSAERATLAGWAHAGDVQAERDAAIKRAEEARAALQAMVETYPDKSGWALVSPQFRALRAARAVLGKEEPLAVPAPACLTCCGTGWSTGAYASTALPRDAFKCRDCGGTGRAL